ncbi:MAG: alpha/beta fold hydrolase [Lewinellaceae bacterium]|nr:alpha/beta fold hydrolase [Lewinellaceae bacterium]MCB9290350.1 alpha/beta fold hydrolase [Lewinellaceae bacterium]
METKRKFLFLLSILIILLAFPFCKSTSPAVSSLTGEETTVPDEAIFQSVLQKRLEEAERPAPKANNPSSGFAMGETGQGQSKFSEVPVYYATDREPTGNNGPYGFYGGKRSSTGLRFGRCMVTIPKIHEIGEIERPSWWSLEFAEDPGEHIILKEISPLQENDFFSELNLKARLADKQEALVFIHGYNTSFDEAALRAAQVAYDVSFAGVPILYSWPSQGTLIGYWEDGENNAWSVPHLEYFLEELAKQNCWEKIHIIAHSMGNRTLTKSLIALARKNPQKPLFGQVILAAPDVNAREFVQEIAPMIRQTASNVTLYASSKDKALALSKQFNHVPRAGEAGENLVVVETIETVDASSIDTDFLGHTYFANTWLLIQDLYEVINKGWNAEKRALKDRKKGNRRYWAF